ncbi:aldo/keto reductase [Micromonospora sp. LOL_024]|uniref:aldo/keto reductase n=1 Tax=Micromonospora sp. LOL_024 TaxID=3345412 RepID=UPI003A8B13FF
MLAFGDPSWRPWVLDEQAAEPVVRRAAEAGVTFFDTADQYSLGISEVVTGRLLRRVFSRREEYVLATKVYQPVGPGPNDRGLSRKHILHSIDASLRRLGVDHVDLYQMHRWDPDTPIEEIMEAFHDVVRAGKARYLGASSMAAWQFAVAQHTALRHGWTRFVSMQNLYNLLDRDEEREMLPYCAYAGVGVLPYSPLSRGLLARVAGRPVATVREGTDHLARRRDDDCDAPVVRALARVAGARGLPPAQAALAWLLGRPTVVCPVIGATRVGHVDDAVAATGVTLTAEEAGLLDARQDPDEGTAEGAAARPSNPGCEERAAR